MTYITKRQRAEMRKKRCRTIAAGFLAVMILFMVIAAAGKYTMRKNRNPLAGIRIPEYSGQAFCVINQNEPFFTEKDKKSKTFEEYSELDRLGRCGPAFANVGRELMPTAERGSIGNIKPSGWIQAKYEGIINAEPPYLYNRCHLIAYCLTAENANERNLITGTRYMNVEGMLPFEEKVAGYLDRYDHHVLYRVTPVFEGENLVASGVLIEAYSVEDHGAGICFCVYCYNVQPGVTIDYRTGKSRPD